MKTCTLTMATVVTLSISGMASAQSLPNVGNDVAEDGTTPSLQVNEIQGNRPVRVQRSPEDKGRIVSPYQGVVDPRGNLLNRQAAGSDRVTAEELRRRIQGTDRVFGKEVKALDPEQKTHLSKEPSLYDDSDILTDGRTHTILPKGAVLRLPDHLVSKMSDKPVGQFILWPDFAKRNRSWIQLREVTFAEASGSQEWSEEEKVMINRLPRVVVAVLDDGPVSVLQNPRLEAEAAKTASVTPAE